MATVLFIQGFRFEVFPNDHPPAHVHVTKAGKRAKVDLVTWEAVRGGTMSMAETSRALAIAQAHAATLWDGWRKYHG